MKLSPFCSCTFIKATSYAIRHFQAQNLREHERTDCHFCSVHLLSFITSIVYFIFFFIISFCCFSLSIYLLNLLNIHNIFGSKSCIWSMWNGSIHFCISSKEELIVLRFVISLRYISRYLSVLRFKYAYKFVVEVYV